MLSKGVHEKSLESFISYHTKVSKKWNGITCSYEKNTSMMQHTKIMSAFSKQAYNSCCRSTALQQYI